MIYTYSKETLLPMKEVWGEPALEVLTFMNFFKRKCELDIKRIKNSSKQNR